MWISLRSPAQVVKDIGYDRAKFGFDCQTCAVLTSIDEQSPDIALGVDTALEAEEGHGRRPGQPAPAIRA